MGLFRRDSKPQEEKPEMVDESLRQATEWQPTTHQKLIMGMLSVISFMVSLVSFSVSTRLRIEILIVFETI
jgi:hypothetical protein